MSRQSGVRPLRGEASGWRRRYLPLAHPCCQRVDERLIHYWRHALTLPMIGVEAPPKGRAYRRFLGSIFAKANTLRIDRDELPPHTQIGRGEITSSLRPVSYASGANRTRHVALQATTPVFAAMRHAVRFRACRTNPCPDKTLRPAACRFFLSCLPPCPPFSPSDRARLTTRGAKIPQSKSAQLGQGNNPIPSATSTFEVPHGARF